jgi:hypothetical protein
MAAFQIKPSAFVYIAKKALHRTETDRSFDKEYRRFRAHFGSSPSTCAILWKKLVDHGDLPQGRQPVHLLWALYFLNRYEIEEVAAATFGVDEETYRKWSWKLVVAIAKLKPSMVSLYFICGGYFSQVAASQRHFAVSFLSSHFCSVNRTVQIKWSNRLRKDVGARCKISVDGTDFRLQQQHPPKEFYSIKFKGSAYRYEVALCIQTGDIVWINGPFKPGLFNDLMVFREGLKLKLSIAGEKAQADGGYPGEKATIIMPNKQDTNQLRKLKKQVRARQEHVNKRFKQFECLQQRFRHPLYKHKSCFWAVVVLTQIAIENNEPLDPVQYGLHRLVRDQNH